MIYPRWKCLTWIQFKKQTNTVCQTFDYATILNSREFNMVKNKTTTTTTKDSGVNTLQPEMA